MISVLTIGSLYWSSQPPIKRETGYSNVLVFPYTVSTHFDLHYAWVFDEVAPIYRATVLKAWRHLIRSRPTELIRNRARLSAEKILHNLPFTLQIISWIFSASQLGKSSAACIWGQSSISCNPWEWQLFFFHFAPFTPHPYSNHLLLMTKGLSD